MMAVNAIMIWYNIVVFQLFLVVCCPVVTQSVLIIILLMIFVTNSFILCSRVLKTACSPVNLRVIPGWKDAVRMHAEK